MIVTMMILTLAAGPAAGGFDPGTGTDGGRRDQCLLDASKCKETGGYPILEKIERLKAAIAQGTAVYTPEELERLEKKLKEAEEINDLIQG